MTLVSTQWIFILMFVVLMAFVLIWRLRKDKNPSLPIE